MADHAPTKDHVVGRGLGRSHGRSVRLGELELDSIQDAIAYARAVNRVMILKTRPVHLGDGVCVMHPRISWEIFEIREGEISPEVHGGEAGV